MSILAAITWDVNPEIFQIGSFAPRWYGVLFASGFLIGYYMVEREFRKDGYDVKWLDSLLLFLVVGTVIGARLGHVFFYEWGYYSQHLSEIPMVWKGGLASHGGVTGVFIMVWVWSRWVSKMPVLWILDRMAAPMALAATFIRTGNLFNSEIVGKPTDLPWAFDFVQNSAFPGPRHPAQLYEALCYFAVFFVLRYFYQKGYAKNRMGFLTGVLLASTFTARFFIEFVKENQVAFEANMALNMGQILSIPIIAIALYLVFRTPRPAPKPKKVTE